MSAWEGRLQRKETSKPRPIESRIGNEWTLTSSFTQRKKAVSKSSSQESHEVRYLCYAHSLPAGASPIFESALQLCVRTKRPSRVDPAAPPLTTRGTIHANRKSGESQRNSGACRVGSHPAVVFTQTFLTEREQEHSRCIRTLCVGVLIVSNMRNQYVVMSAGEPGYGALGGAPCWRDGLSSLLCRQR